MAITEDIYWNKTDSETNLENFLIDLGFKKIEEPNWFEQGGLQVIVATPGKMATKMIATHFGFTPNQHTVYRFIKTHLADAQKLADQTTRDWLRHYQGDAVVLDMGELPVIKRIAGRLTLNSQAEGYWTPEKLERFELEYSLEGMERL